MTTYPKLLCVSLLFGLGCALAQSNAQPKAQPESKTQTPEQPRASALTGEWLYEILLGELQVLQGDTGAGFSLLLDAARQSGDERLYERAVDVALRVRSGDGALLAASAWRQAAPQSEKANRKLLQIQVALQKLKDARYSLTQAVVLAAPEDKASIILSMPKLLERVSQQAQASQILQEALTTWLSDTELGPVAWTAIGQMQLAARDPAAALQSAQRGFELNQKRIEPLWLGLELARSQPKAAGWMAQIMPGIDHPGLNLAWARVLVELKQFNQAESLLQERAQKNTADPSSWLLLGAVRLEMNRPQDAAQAWQRFLKETAQQPKRNAERDQALMGLAQISLDAKDDAQAVQWLSQVSDGNNLLRANVMRASILARQGQVNEGRAVIANMPVRTQKQEIARTLAEAQYLRQNKLWQEVYDLLSLAANKFEDDDELDYELATAAEKIGRVDQMEALLRGIIERSPDFHQAYNALGYSLADRNVQLNEARRLIVKALEMAPDDPFITDSLGWVEFRLGRLKEAKEILARAYEAKADAEIAAHLGEVLWAAGERENAMTVWRQGLQLAPDNETLQDTLRRLGVKP